MWKGIILLIFASTGFAQHDVTPLVLSNRAGLDVARRELRSFNQNAATVVITTHNSTRYTGKLLLATDSLLVLSKKTALYDLRQLDESIYLIAASEIEKITIVKKASFRKRLGYGYLGMTLGGIGLLASGSPRDDTREMADVGSLLLLAVLIGATVGLDDHFIVERNLETYLALQPRLRKESFYPSAPPPEVIEYLQHGQNQGLRTSSGVETMAGQKDDDSASKTTIAVSKNEIRRFKASPAKLHLSLSSVAFGPNTSNAMGRAFQSSGFGGTEANWLFGGSITYPLDYSDPATWNIGVEYNLINKIRLGLSGHKIPKQEVIGKSEEKEIASGSSYQFSIDYVPKPCAPLLLSRLELSFGAGNSYNSFSIDGELRPSTDNSIFSWSEGAPTRVPFRIPARRVFGTHLKAAIDYYPARAFSFQFKIQRRTRPAIEVPEQKQTFEITTFSFLGHVIDKRSETKTLRKHTVDFSGVETSVGIRFHL